MSMEKNYPIDNYNEGSLYSSPDYRERKSSECAEKPYKNGNAQLSASAGELDLEKGALGAGQGQGNSAEYGLTENPGPLMGASVRDKKIEEQISHILIEAGIRTNNTGYKFLREAIKIAMNDPPVIESITKRLYPAVAARHYTNASKVERGIRTAIQASYDSGKVNTLNAEFGINVFDKNEKLPNGEFIALIADLLSFRF